MTLANQQPELLPLDERDAVDGWRAWHVFLFDNSEQDLFLRQAVAPLVRDFAVSAGPNDPGWFFIRYWENGPHLRLRFRGLSDEQFGALGEKLLAGAQEVLKTKELPKQEGDGFDFPDSWHADPGNLPVFAAGTVAEIGYELENRRYGGPHCRPGCEAMFGRSSQLAIEALETMNGDFAPLRGMGLLFHALSAAAACEGDSERMAEFARTTQRHWGNYLGKMIDEANAHLRPAEGAVDVARKVVSVAQRAWEGQTPGNPLAARWWRMLIEERTRIAQLAEAGALRSPVTGARPTTPRQTDAAIANILSSHIHMMMNRLGIAPILEYQFAGMLAEAQQKTK